MKKRILILFLFISNACLAQQNVIDSYYQDFQGQHTLDMASVSSKMFEVFLKSKEGKEKEELATILRQLTGLKVLSKENPKNGLDLYQSACQVMPAGYETILILKEADRNATFYTKEDKSGKINELVMIAFQWGRFLIVSVTGDINLNDILKLSQHLNLQGLGDALKRKNQVKP